MACRQITRNFIERALRSLFQNSWIMLSFLPSRVIDCTIEYLSEMWFLRAVQILQIHSLVRSSILRPELQFIPQFCLFCFFKNKTEKNLTFIFMTGIHYFITSLLWCIQFSLHLKLFLETLNIKSLLHVYEACKHVFAHSTCMKLQGPQNPWKGLIHSWARHALIIMCICPKSSYLAYLE